MVSLIWREAVLGGFRRFGKGTFEIVCDEHGVIPFQKHSGPYQAWKRHVTEHSQPEKLAMGAAMAKSTRSGYPVSNARTIGSEELPPF